LSQVEIDKFVNLSVADFIPNNLNEFSFEFDELGILKQVFFESEKIFCSLNKLLI
jgi:hypothetical protein